MMNVPAPAWCLSAKGDGEAYPTCNAASGTDYVKYDYAGNAHGMMLIAPDQKPKGFDKNTLELFLDVLELTFEQ